LQSRKTRGLFKVGGGEVQVVVAAVAVVAWCSI
jgi:hypothetical protein